MTKLADRRPPYCSGCFGHPEGRYVDFEAAYDGPTIPGSPANIPVDDLILCEGCLLEAFSILDPQSQQETIAALTQQVKDLEEDVAAKDKIIAGAAETNSILVDHPIKKPAGRYPLVGLSDEQSKVLTERRYNRSARSKAKKAANEREKANA